MTQNADTDSIINFNRALKTIIGNKKSIIICFLISMSVGFLLNFILPKKYTSEAKILIKKTGSTNLSYINPYIIPEIQENNNHNGVFLIKNALNEEIEIIKSPLVINNVIKENDLKYQKGPLKGKYLSAEDFLKTKFTISKLKNVDIIYIAYKSKDPVLSYKIVNSVINNYQKTEENFNIKKALEDTEFLKQACLKTEKELDYKINRLKKYNIQPQSIATSSIAGLSLLGFYDKRFKQKLKQISDSETDLKKLEIEITQKTEELNILKKKLEWSMLVKKMSKNTTDMIILQSPEISDKYNFSEPQPLIIFVLSFVGWIFMCFAAINLRIHNT